MLISASNILCQLGYNRLFIRSTPELRDWAGRHNVLAGPGWTLTWWLITWNYWVSWVLVHLDFYFRPHWHFVFILSFVKSWQNQSLVWPLLGVGYCVATYDEKKNSHQCVHQTLYNYKDTQETTVNCVFPLFWVGTAPSSPHPAHPSFMLHV